jgi:hypothetical protein
LPAGDDRDGKLQRGGAYCGEPSGGKKRRCETLRGGRRYRGVGGEGEFLPASASQLDYVRRLASRIGRAAALRVEALAKRRFGKPLAELSRNEATHLILTLRAVKAGELDWETVLEESAG